VFALVLLFVFVGFDLILVASVTGSALWAWGSVGVSVAAAAILVVDWAKRWTAVGDGDRIGLSVSGSAPKVGSPTSTLPPAAAQEDPVTEVFESVFATPPAPAVQGGAPDGMSLNGDDSGARLDVVAEQQDGPDQTAVAEAVTGGVSDASPEPVPPEGDGQPTATREDEVASAPEPGEEGVDPAAVATLATLDDEVFVVDEQPRYHLAHCPSLVGHESIPLPAKEAVDCEFTPCGMCTPVQVLVGASAEAPDSGRSS
jgi:hypothetical protein